MRTITNRETSPPIAGEIVGPVAEVPVLLWKVGTRRCMLIRHRHVRPLFEIFVSEAGVRLTRGVFTDDRSAADFAVGELNVS